MAEPSLKEVFGDGATQTASTITIAKSDLSGLTPSATNTAESLLVALLLRAKNFLNETAFNADLNFNVYINSGFPSFSVRGPNNTQYRIDQLTVNLAKLDTSSTIDPDDY